MKENFKMTNVELWLIGKGMKPEDFEKRALTLMEDYAKHIIRNYVKELLTAADYKAGCDYYVSERSINREQDRFLK